ncbi:phospholipase [Micromonosporaceae bacterium Da 78-11]
MTRRILLVLVLALAALLPAGAAQAARAAADKPAVLAGWTQPTAGSTAAWNKARLDQGSWTSYGFNWTTDYCTASPDNPLGFNFENSCWHHDFGYRNYKSIGQFPANKDRIDDTFYADLRRVCATYLSIVRPACYSLAWTYYQAVHVFGSLAKVNRADIDKAARIKAQASR